MNRQAYDESRHAREMAGAEALGMLGELLRLQVLPIQHREQATKIVAEWTVASAACSSALRQEPCGYCSGSGCPACAMRGYIVTEVV